MLLLCSLFFCLGMNVYAASNPYSSKGPYGVNCTWYTWKKVNELQRKILLLYGILLHMDMLVM